MPRNHCEKMTKDGATRLFCWSVDKRQARDNGWVLVGAPAAPKPEPVKLPEIVVEAGTTAYDSTDAIQEPQTEEGDLDGMTKAELLDWAMDQGHDLKNALPKSEILETCKQIEGSL